MPNGERRRRLTDAMGLGYVLTEASEEGGWQDSHLHRGLSETYVVQRGWIAVAEISAGHGFKIQVLRPGAIWTALPGVIHNIYMSPHAVTHVVKHGEGGQSDWIRNAATDRLDRWSKALSEQDLLSRRPSPEQPSRVRES